MICGYDLGGGRECQRRVKGALCWQHGRTGKKTSGRKTAAQRAASLSLSQSAQPPEALPQAKSKSPRRKRSAPPPRPNPAVLPGTSVLQDSAALTWLVNETRRHTAGNGPGLSPFQIMQNYHGVSALSRLTQPGALPHGVDAVFAGGTCLALGHHLVERYSQDIDIVLVGGDQLDPGQRDEVLDAVGAAVSSGTGLTHKSERRGPHFIRKEMFYQRTLEPSSVPTADMFVKTDVGFADHLPPQDITTVAVDTYLALRGSRPFAAHYGDLSVVEVLAVRPSVTLVEKLIALHQRASVGERRSLMSRARDVLDIGCLLDDAPTIASLQRPGSTPTDIDARQIQRAQSVPPGTPAAKRQGIRRPLGGFADSPVWQNGHRMNQALRQAYASSIGALTYDRSKKPAFDEVVERVHANRALL